MSMLVVKPETLLAAAAQLEGMAPALGAANAAALGRITGLVAAGEDEVSVGIASVFSECGKAYELLSVQLARFHAQFVQATRSAAEQYQAAENEFAAWLAARQAYRASMQSLAPIPNDTSPAGGGG